MSRHLTKNQLEDYSRRRLSAAELLSVSDHLSLCETCQLQVERALDGDSVFLALQRELFDDLSEAALPPASTHLTFEQTADFIDGMLTGEVRQAVTDHLSGCEQCHMAVADLRAFRNLAAPVLDREPHPASAHSRTENRSSPLTSFLTRPWLRSPLPAISATLIVILLLLSGWMISQRLQKKGMGPEEAVTTPAPVLSPNAVPTVSVTPQPAQTDSAVIAELADGRRLVTLDRSGRLSGAEDLPAGYQQMISAALLSGQPGKSPLLAGLMRPGSALMGGDEQGNHFSVIEPVGKVLLSARPTFRWSHLSGATGYVVEIYDEKFNLILTSPQLTGTSWTLPQALERGRVYLWQVKAGSGGKSFLSPRPTAPQAKFHLLDQKKVNELDQARRAYASSHLTMGLLYARAGLLDEGEREFRALQKQNPHSEVARRLLAAIRSMRRR